jgi:hypothetical protein
MKSVFSVNVEEVAWKSEVVLTKRGEKNEKK